MAAAPQRSGGVRVVGDTTLTQLPKNSRQPSPYGNGLMWTVSAGRSRSYTIRSDGDGPAWTGWGCLVSERSSVQA